MEVFFNHTFPTFGELSYNLEYIEKRLEKSSDTKNLSLMILPEYLLDIAMLRTNPSELQIFIDKEINELLCKYKQYTQMVRLGLTMIINNNKYLEKLFIELASDVLEEFEYYLKSNEKQNYDSKKDIRRIKNDINFKTLDKNEVIEIKDISGLIYYTLLINKAIKEEGIEVINQLDFKYTDGLFYESLAMISKGLDVNEFINIYIKTTLSYIEKECLILKNFLMMISAHSEKIGEVYKFEKKKNRKRDFESFYKLSFCGLSANGKMIETDKKTLFDLNTKHYDNEALIEFMHKIYFLYYNNNNDLAEIKSYIKKAPDYSLFLYDLMNLWVNRKDLNFFKDNMEHSIGNYIMLYEMALDCITSSLKSMYNKESLMITREKLSLFLIPSDDSEGIDWERPIPKYIWESLDTIYPDQYDDYIAEVLKYIAQLMFNLADNNYRTEPISGKRLEEMEGFISYGINLLNQSVEPSLFAELLEIKKDELIIEYRKRLLIISEISRISNYYDVEPDEFKHRLSNYLSIT